MMTVTTSEARQRWGRVLDAAKREPVTITEHGRPTAVLMDADLSGRALAALRRETSTAAPQGVAAWRRREEGKMDAIAARWSALAKPGTRPLQDAAAYYSERPAKA
ncbi:MAG: type II toxin-antitoxin system Phd/YefM family antitoxin [Propionibacteriaceae bacterium]|jgi:prevent-host-death family protein|nr:type II toxin-antitoxin system Phd/YefM family antitoxin [Propionibacteriaceae bacterium]